MKKKKVAKSTPFRLSLDNLIADAPVTLTTIKTPPQAKRRDMRPFVFVALVILALGAVGLILTSKPVTNLTNSTSNTSVSYPIWTTKAFVGCDNALKEALKSAQTYYSSGKYNCYIDKVNKEFDCIHAYRNEVICRATYAQP